MSEPARFTVISWATPSYRHRFDGLREDCARWGYPCHLYEIDDHYLSLVRAWCNHPRVIRRGIDDFGSVLFLDAECRIVRPVPEHWRAPLVSVRQPEQKFWIRYNSGTVMADRDSIPWVDAWIRLVDDWRMGDLGPDDYVRWPGDLCDELALAGALGALGIRPATPALEYEDRARPAELARGLWSTPLTVVQHPTVHHWPGETDPTECKKLFVQNYPGDPAEADALFAAGGGPVRRHDWVFHPDARVYAPEEFWDAAPRPWMDGPVTLTASQR